MSDAADLAAAPELLTIHHIIATHAEMLAAFNYGSIPTEPAAFICRLGEIVDDPTLANPKYRGAVDRLSLAVTSLAEALDRPEGSAARTEFLQVANRHLYDLAAHTPAREG